MSNDKDSQLIWENYFKEKQHGKYDDGDGKEERCDHVPCGEDDGVKKVDEELDRGDEAGDYVSFLRNMASELINNDMPEEEAFENVLSHPFEETYGEYLRTKGVAGVYIAAKAHLGLAEKTGAYHEVDMNALQNWRYS